MESKSRLKHRLARLFQASTLLRTPPCNNYSTTTTSSSIFSPSSVAAGSTSSRRSASTDIVVDPVFLRRRSDIVTTAAGNPPPPLFLTGKVDRSLSLPLSLPGRLDCGGCRPTRTLSTRDLVHKKNTTKIQEFSDAAVAQGNACPPASPSSPKKTQFCFEDKNKTSTEKKEKGIKKTKKKLLSNGYGFSSSSSDEEEFEFSSSGEDEEEEADTFFSSRSFSSDSSGFYRRPSSNRNRITKKKREKENNRQGRSRSKFDKTSDSNNLHLLFRTTFQVQRDLQEIGIADDSSGPAQNKDQGTTKMSSGSDNKKLSGRPPRHGRNRSNEGFRPVISMVPSKKKVEEGGGEEEKSGFPVTKRSKDPYVDFRDSMVEMIVERQIFGTKDLEQLLRSYLSLNSPHHHSVILRAFADISEVLFGH